MIVNVLDHGPRDRQPVVGAGAAPDLVQHDQAAVRGVMQDVGRLDHLDHEGGLARRDFVLRADARKDAIHQAERGRVRRHERADLRHQHDQRDLAQKRGLAAHVRAGDDQDALVRVKAHIVGHERHIRKRLLDDRMPPADDVQLVGIGQPGAHVAIADGDLRQRHGHVNLRDGARRLRAARSRARRPAGRPR